MIRVCHANLRMEIANHEVRTVTESGWSGLENGALLALAEVEFDVFLTVDQNLFFSRIYSGSISELS